MTIDVNKYKTTRKSDNLAIETKTLGALASLREAVANTAGNGTFLVKYHKETLRYGVSPCSPCEENSSIVLNETVVKVPPRATSGSYPPGASQSGYNGAGVNTPAETTSAATSNVFNFEPESDPMSKAPERTPRDAELGRLRKIEANYEKDKASLTKQKQPALTRSESHEVGHAGK